MFCDQCGNPVGDSEKFCSRCGAPILPLGQEKTEAESSEQPVVSAESEQAAASAEPEQPVVSVVSEQAAASAEPERPVVSAESEQAAASAEPEQPVVSVVSEQPVALSVPVKQEPPVAPAIPEEPVVRGKKGGKKSGKKTVFFALGGVLLVLVAVCVVNAGKIANFFSRSFSSPEKYYRQIEQETVERMAEQYSTYYKMLVENPLRLDETSLDTEFTVELGEGGKNFMSLLDMSGVDISWLSELNMGVGFSWKENLVSYALSFGMNRSELLSVNMLMDVIEGTAYFQVPELNEKYMKVDGYGTELYETEALELYHEMQERQAKILSTMPEAAEVEKLLQKYMNLALDSVDDVSRKQKTLKAGGVSEKCTELEIIFDGKCLADMLDSISKEMLKDKDLKEMIVSVADAMAELDDSLYYSQSGEEAYEEFTAWLENMRDSLDELKSADGELIMKVYVGGKGRIVGRTLETVESDGTRTEISFLMPESGKSIGCEVSLMAVDGSRIALTGSGKKSGEKLTGSYELAYDGVSLLEMNVSGLDLEQLKQGYLNGTFTLMPSKMLGTLLTGSVSGYGSLYATMLADMELKLDSHMSKNSGKFTIGLLYDEEEIISLSASANVGKGPGTDIPDAANLIVIEEDEDLAAWMEGLSWDKFLKGLEDAGVPEDLREELLEGIELFSDGNYGFEGLYGMGDVPANPYDPDGYDEPYGEDSWYGDNDNQSELGSDYGNSAGNDNQEASSSLEAILESEDWQTELSGWNEGVAELGIILDTVADGNTLVFVYYLPDGGSFDETVCSAMSDVFLGILSDEDFISMFYTGYGVSLDAVRCTFVGADGSEIYRDEIY